MEDAFNRRYRWSESFKGFSADFAFTREGKTVKGSIKADATKPHGGVTVECADEEVKKLVSDTVGSTVTHTRASNFEKAFGSCSFAIAGDWGPRGHEDRSLGSCVLQGFHRQGWQHFENHGGHGEMSSEVKVQHIVWMAECGKTLPRAYAFTIKTGDHEQSGKNVESWHETDGVWLPARMHLVRNEGSAAPVESMLTLENSRSSRRDVELGRSLKSRRKVAGFRSLPAGLPLGIAAAQCESGLAAAGRRLGGGSISSTATRPTRTPSMSRGTDSPGMRTCTLRNRRRRGTCRP